MTMGMQISREIRPNAYCEKRTRIKGRIIANSLLSVASTRRGRGDATLVERPIEDQFRQASSTRY
jgi:hypothetical protein